MFAILSLIILTLIVKVLPYFVRSISEGDRFNQAVAGAMDSVIDCMQYAVPNKLFMAFALGVVITVLFRIFKLNA